MFGKHKNLRNRAPQKEAPQVIGTAAEITLGDAPAKLRSIVANMQRIDTPDELAEMIEHEYMVTLPAMPPEFAKTFAQTLIRWADAIESLFPETGTTGEKR